MDASRQTRVRLFVWALASAYLILHVIVATCLPAWLDPLSTCCIVLAEWAAIAALLRKAGRALPSMRVLWALVLCSVAFHSTAMSLDAVNEITQRPVLNYVPAFSIFFSMLYGVPLLVAVSIQTGRRLWDITRAVHALLSLAIGVVLYIQIFSLLTINGSKNAADAMLIAHLFDVLDVFLAAAASIRWLGSYRPAECSFFRILSIFLWVNAICPAIHNRILLAHDYVWLDLFISAPYALLFGLVLTARESPVPPRSLLMVRAVRSGSSLFLTLALVLEGILAIGSHFAIGLAAVFLAVAAYAVLNIVTLSRRMESEESLLASKRNLELLVGVDGLTGIGNRRAFDRVLDREFAVARRSRLPLSLLMIDVDHFKQINDTKGHQAGDEYLARISSALRVALPRATDFLARYGGEEFSAILPATDHTGAGLAASKLQQGVFGLGLSHPTAPSGAITVSIGFSTFDGRTEHLPSQLIRTADRALFLAKREGRNCCRYLPLDGHQG